MKSAAETGSISRRRRPSVRRWMRASRRALAPLRRSRRRPGVKRPRSATPSPSRRASAAATALAREAEARGEVGRRVVGPTHSSQPRTIVDAARSSSSLGSRRAGGRRRAPASKRSAGTARARDRDALGGDERARARAVVPSTSRDVARRVREQLVGPRLPSRRARRPAAAPSDSSASCSSSASRTSGQACARTAAIAAASSAPMPAGELGIGAAQRHGAGAALLERRVVEEGVRVGVQDLVRHRRRRRRLDGDRADARRASMPLEHGAQAVGVHRLVQAVVERLVDQRVVGRLDRAGVVVAAGELRGEDGGQQILGAHALDRASARACRRCGAAAPARGVAFQRQRVAEHRRLQRRLHEVVARAVATRTMREDARRAGSCAARRARARCRRRWPPPAARSRS